MVEKKKTVMFWLKNADAYEEFLNRVKELQIDNETNRINILKKMSTEGLVERAISTERDPDKVIEDYKKHYKILDMRKEK